MPDLGLDQILRDRRLKESDGFRVISLNISVVGITTKNVEECVISVVVISEEVGSLVPRLCVTRVLPIFGIKRVHRSNDLRDVILCLGPFRLVLHACKRGKSSAIRIAMTVMTTSNSIRVKPPRNLALENSSRSLRELRDGRFRSSGFPSRPFQHLFGEGTLRAVGVVLQAKVFVDLEQTLLLRHSPQEPRPARVVAKEPRRAGLEPPVGEAGGQLGVIRPDDALPQLPKRQDDVRQNLGHARLANECHLRGCRIGGERVMEIPIRMRQTEKKFPRRIKIVFA